MTSSPRLIVSVDPNAPSAALAKQLVAAMDLETPPEADASAALAAALTQVRNAFMANTYGIPPSAYLRAIAAYAAAEIRAQTRQMLEGNHLPEAYAALGIANIGDTLAVYLAEALALPEDAVTLERMPARMAN